MIEVKDITFAYKEDKILEDISFDIEQGAFIAVLGNNGAGKSTLIKCLNRINQPLGGSIIVDGQDIYEIGRNETAKKIAYVAQKLEASHMTVYDSILLGRKPHMKWGMSKEDYEIAENVMNQMGLEEYKLRDISELSGGELQKVVLARALTQQPQLLLLDEPTSNLDPNNQYKVMKMVKEIAKDRNIAVLVVIHDLNLALRYCDHFLMIKNHRVYSYGDINAITQECIEQVYDMPVQLIDYHNIKMVVPYPSDGGLACC